MELVCKNAWWRVVKVEGWGQLDGSHGSTYSNMYIASRAAENLRDPNTQFPLGLDDVDLTIGISLATYPPQIPSHTSHPCFAIGKVIYGSIGRPIAGSADDGGDGIGWKCIDLYVGVRDYPGGNSANKYTADSWPNIPVTW